MTQERQAQEILDALRVALLAAEAEAESWLSKAVRPRHGQFYLGVSKTAHDALDLIGRAK